MNNYLKNKWLWLFVVILATVMAYFKIFHFDFVYWDDDKQILNNIYVKILSEENIKHESSIKK